MTGELDYRLVFEQSAGPCLVLAADPPRFTIVAGSDAFVREAGGERAAIAGRGVFEVVTTGVAELRASLDHVIATRTADALSAPVVTDGALRYIVHRVAGATAPAALVRASHALRSPLTSILGFADLIAEGPDPLSAAQREYLDYVRDSGRQLQQVLDGLVGPPRPATTADPPAPAAATARGRILLVEDDALTRRLVAVLLREEGHDVIEAGSFGEARAALDACWPDLVATDIGYDGGGGRALLAAIRRDPRGADLPVVAVTGSASRPELDELVRAGFDGHVTKPIDVGELTRLIATLIARAADR